MKIQPSACPQASSGGNSSIFANCSPSSTTTGDRSRPDSGGIKRRAESQQRFVDTVEETDGDYKRWD